MKFLHFLLLSLTVWIPSLVNAHALEPAFLDIREYQVSHYNVAWKVPQVSGQPMTLQAFLPANCSNRNASQLMFTGAAFSANWNSICTNGIAGGEIWIDGLQGTTTDVLVRLQPIEGSAITLRLTPSQPKQILPANPNLMDIAITYLLLGIEHILTGFDHILFVLALILLVGRSTSKLVKTITAFTLVHSVTLSVAALGYVTFPVAPVEAIIALSIIYLAREIAVRRDGQTRLSERQPWLVAFLFGLLHGLGFAGALATIGLPENEIPAALLTFNLGVEVGQLLFIAGVLILRWLLATIVKDTRTHQQLIRTSMTGSVYAIGGVSTYWLIDRMTGFWL